MVQLLGKDVGTTGFGLMSFHVSGTDNYDVDKNIKVMKAALNAGARFWNGGEFYGKPENNSLHLLNAYFTKYPEDAEKVVLSIKGAFSHATGPLGDEAGVRGSVDNCLKVLDGKKKLDLFECARVDPKTPIEETMRVLDSYVKEGKLGGISLSETGAKTIRRAAAVTKISCVEIEFSMFATEAVSNGVTETCAELGIPIVGYSPLGRGFLTGQFKTIDDVPEWCRRFPRYQPGNFEKNIKLAHEVDEIAKTKGCTTSQVAMAWVKAHSGAQGFPDILPIPGTSKENRMLENMNDVKLETAELDTLNELVKNAEIAGNRYPDGVNEYSYA